MSHVQDHQNVTQILLQVKHAGRLYRDQAAVAFIKKPELIATLVGFVSHPEDPLADRCCWTLELICLQDPGLLCPYADELIAQLQHCDTDRKRRPLAKIFSLLSQPETRLQDPVCDLSDKAVNALIDWCFDQLIEQRSVAVKVFAMQALYHLRDRNSWIRDELRSILEENIFEEGPGYRARAKKILGQI